MPLSATATSLAEVLDEMTAEGAPELTEYLSGDALKCYACGHRCLIKEGKRGICKVRFNEGGHLLVPVNYVAALQCDPTEKKPFFHALPGSDTLTFGMLGCDLHCAYCQNWLTSQALRDDKAVSPPNIVDRKSTRLNSSHGYISYAVFCLKKKNTPEFGLHRAAWTYLLNVLLLSIYDAPAASRGVLDAHLASDGILPLCLPMTHL